MWRCLVVALLAGCLSRGLKKDKGTSVNTPLTSSPQEELIRFQLGERSWMQGFALDDGGMNKVDGRALTVRQFVVGKYLVGSRIVPAATFVLDPQADFVSFQTCPEGTSDCRLGTAVTGRLTWMDLTPGKYTISVRACAAQDRAADTASACGPFASASWVEGSFKETAKDVALANIYSEFSSYGGVVHSLLGDFQDGFGECPGVGQRLVKVPDGNDVLALQVWQLRAQIGNWISLGPERIAYCLQGVGDPGSWTELEQILKQVVVEQPRVNIKAPPDDPLKRLDAERLGQHFKARWFDILGAKQTILGTSLQRKLLASAGASLDNNQELGKFRQKWKPMPATVWGQLSDRQKAAWMSLAMLLSAGQELPEEKAYTYGCFESLAALFNLETKMAFFPECAAITKLRTSLDTVRARITALQKNHQDLH